MGFQDIILEGDSLIVVKAIGELETNWRPFGQIVYDTKEVLGPLKSRSICHVRIEANQAAHGLVKTATSSSIDRIWKEKTPNCIYYIVTLELFALSV